MHLIDTKVCVEFVRGTSPRVREALLSHTPFDVGVPAIVEAELLFGARHSRHPEAALANVTAFLRPLRIVPFDSACSQQYGIVRQHLTVAGRLIDPHDMLIAATALAQSGVLVTHNLAEFSRVPGLMLEDWQ